MSEEAFYRFITFTDRQLQVANLLSTHTFAEIGEELGISRRTVQAHCDVMRQKSNTSTVKQLVGYLKLEGFIG